MAQTRPCDAQGHCSQTPAQTLPFPGAVTARAGEGENHPSPISSLFQAGLGAAGPEAETGHSPKPPEGHYQRAFTAWTTGYQGLQGGACWERDHRFLLRPLLEDYDGRG
jgi:hypothetical protein